MPGAVSSGCEVPCRPVDLVNLFASFAEKEELGWKQYAACGMSDPGQQWNFTAEHQQRFLQQQMAFQQQQALLQQRAQHRQLPPQAVASQQAPVGSLPGPSSMEPPVSSQMLHQLPGSAAPPASSTPGALPAPGGVQQQQQAPLSAPAAAAPGMPATGTPASMPPHQLGHPSAGASSGFKVLLSRSPSSPSVPLPATQAYSGQPPLVAPPARPSMQAPAHSHQTIPTVAPGSGSGTQQLPPSQQQPPGVHNLLRQQSGGTSEQSSDRQSGRSAHAPSAPNAWQNGSTSGLGRSSSSIASKTAPGAVVWAKLQRYPWWPAQVLDERDPFIPEDNEAPRYGAVPVRFFGTYNFCWIEAHRNLAPLDEDFEGRSSKSKVATFLAGVSEAVRFQRTRELPEPFSQAVTFPTSELSARRASAAGGAGESPLNGDRAAKAKRAKRPPQFANTPQGRAAKRQAIEYRQRKIMRRLALAPPLNSPFAAKPCIDGLQNMVNRMLPEGAEPPAIGYETL
eukprot:jgi/Astpho2/4043/Aster-01199